MSKTTSQSRRQRRAYELWLKKNNPAAYKQWKSQSFQRGKTLSNEFEEKVRENETTRLEKIQAELINKLSEEGKTQEEIDRHVNVWAMTLKPWGSDEKRLKLKDAEKEYDTIKNS
jgi:hypothetical protein